jgi:hypothetical protein
LREIIGEDDAPFIYERVGLWIHHFLIDEFQDTSRLQWENLRPLLREGQSNDDDSLIIGDEKQCIYRFRDSDPTLLQHQVANGFPGSVKQHPNNNGASTNWRSSATVIKFNNALFKSLAQKNGFDDIYKNVEQRVAPTNDNNRGYVKITAIESSLKEEFHDESLEILTNDICRKAHCLITFIYCITPMFTPSYKLVITNNHLYSSNKITFLNCLYFGLAYPIANHIWTAITHQLIIFFCICILFWKQEQGSFFKLVLKFFIGIIYIPSFILPFYDST